jgi:hypothetical protein
MPAYSFNSATLFHIAQTARDRARDNAADATVAIVFAVSAVESFLNEILDRLRFDHNRDQPELERARTMSEAAELFNKNAKVALKIQILSAALSGVTMDRGAQPLQDFDLLVKVRNILVHYRPEVLPESGKPVTHESLYGRLAEKGLVPPQSSEEISFIFNSLLNHKVAIWACDAARNMIGSVAKLLPSPIGKLALSGYHAIGILHDENGS